MSKETLIFFLVRDDQGCFRVGYTKNPNDLERRIKILKGSPNGYSELIYKVECKKKIVKWAEKRIHQEYKMKKIKKYRKWFRFSRSDISKVKWIMTRFSIQPPERTIPRYQSLTMYDED